MRNFSLNNQCAVVEELACFQNSLNDKNSNYREKRTLILNIQVSSHPRGLIRERGGKQIERRDLTELLGYLLTILQRFCGCDAADLK